MTFPQVILHVVFSVVLLLSVVECAKDLPSGITQHHYCHGCIATLQELLKKVPPSKKKKGREATVMDAMDNICSNVNFKTYTYSPPKIVKACKLLLEENEEEIEQAFTKHTGGEHDLVKEICHDLTGACVGVDLKEGDEGKFSDINLKEDGESDMDGNSRSVHVDPETGKVVKKKEAKTLSKSDKKKKDKKKKKGDTKKSKKVIRDDGKPGKPGVEKGALHNLNIDINDPDSVARVMEQISKIKQDVEGGGEGGGRDEL